MGSFTCTRKCIIMEVYLFYFYIFQTAQHENDSRGKCYQSLKAKKSVTLIPVLVASLTASSSLSYFELKVTVKAQSIIRPERSSDLINCTAFP